MKLTKQRLKEIIKEELLNERIPIIPKINMGFGEVQTKYYKSIGGVPAND